MRAHQHQIGLRLSITRLSILRLKQVRPPAPRWIQRVPLNNKTLNSEIETSQASCLLPEIQWRLSITRLSILRLKHKLSLNLGSELMFLSITRLSILRLKLWPRAWRCKSDGDLSITRLSILRLKHWVPSPSGWKTPTLNNKTLNSEIETWSDPKVAHSGRALSITRLSILRLKLDHPFMLRGVLRDSQ